MNIQAVGHTISAIPSNAIKGVNSIGETTLNATANAKKAVSSHIPQVIKNNKKTIAGSVVILAAISSLTGLIAGIRSKIHQDK